MEQKKNTVYCEDRLQWRQWLSEHFETETEVWFVFPCKSAGETGLYIEHGYELLDLVIEKEQNQGV